MFDSIFNLLIFLIPLAMFIGRIVYQARSKHESPPDIPIHFEDDEDEEEERLATRDVSAAEQDRQNNDEFRPYSLYKGVSENNRNLPIQTHPASARVVSQMSNSQGQPVVTLPVTKMGNLPQTTTPAAAAGQRLSQRLNHLSPLKQAVIMAEILGTPKGLQ